MKSTSPEGYRNRLDVLKQYISAYFQVWKRAQISVLHAITRETRRKQGGLRLQFVPFLCKPDSIAMTGLRGSASAVYNRNSIAIFHVPDSLRGPPNVTSTNLVCGTVDLWPMTAIYISHRALLSSQILPQLQRIYESTTLKPNFTVFDGVWEVVWCSRNDVTKGNRRRGRVVPNPFSWEDCQVNSTERQSRGGSSPGLLYKWDVEEIWAHEFKNMRQGRDDIYNAKCEFNVEFWDINNS